MWRSSVKAEVTALKKVADRVGFEPTVRCRITGFQDRLLKPLGHLSILSVVHYSHLTT